MTTGVEPHLVGLSPTYWCHVPLLIAHIHTQVALVHGIHCRQHVLSPRRPEAPMISPPRQCEDEEEEEEKRERTPNQPLPPPPPVKMIPLSKCHLVGTIVSAEHKASGAVLYVLDDGTGLIDVLFWMDRYLDDDDDEMVRRLTSVGASRTNGGTRSATSVYSVGTLVRVLGSLHSVMMMMEEEEDVPSWSVDKRKTENAWPDASNDAAPPTTTQTPMLRWWGWGCRHRTMYEIHATLVEPVSFHAEYRHWTKCARTHHHPDPSQSNLYHARDVMAHLGSDMARQMAHRPQLAAVKDDSIGAWRLFGTQCHCTVEYKDSLLYCHCIASIEPLDPLWEYRDALLHRLLQMENEHCSSSGSGGSGSSGSGSGSGSSSGSGGSNWNQRDTITSMHTDHLRFHYKTISTDSFLNETARRILLSLTTKASTTATICSQRQRLVARTFRALCKDGILYLLDADLDTYILVSRAKLLDPYLKAIASTSMEQADERAYFRQNRPAYLAHVPKARLELAKRLLSAAASAVGEI